MRAGRKQEKLLIQYITENQERAYRMAYNYVRNKEDALDIVQDAIHKAFMYIENLKNMGSLKSWFWRCRDYDSDRGNPGLYTGNYHFTSRLSYIWRWGGTKGF
ncbi:sigma factor [Paenibacillus sp. CF095]|uniref:sigma factor n=1 Tax=Paenibacillus sp. CF095 TaxID=1881033 RepID=UPI000A574700|nr:sigma factor [Paenibacillus sp. CF095]